MRGEKIYEYDLDVTGMADYDVTLVNIPSGKEKVPLQGACFDVAFEGHARDRSSGRVRSIDYVQMCADGRISLDIRASIDMDDGRRVALSAGGVGLLCAAEPIADLCENICLTTSATDYAWLNAPQLWGVGTVNFATGKSHIGTCMQ